MLAAALRRVGLAVALAACSSSSTSPGGGDAGTIDPSNCPSDLPASCPTPTPSFNSQVNDIIQRKCGACHTGNGVEASAHEFSTYATIAPQRSAMLNQVYACRMPPPDAPGLTVDERAALLGWLVCKAPDN